MKNKLLILITILLAAVLCFAACSNKPDDNDGDAADLAIKSIEVVEGTIPAQVNRGDTPDFSGVKVKVTFEDDTTKEVGVADGVKVGTLDTMEAGLKVVSVTYGDKTVKVEIMVVDLNSQAVVTNIKIIGVDDKYHLGQIPDMSGFQVEAIYSTGKTDALAASEYTYTAIDTSSEGKKTFTVTYTADPEITASLEYEVIGITNMAVVTGTVPKKINVGDTLDTSAIQLSVEYADGKSEIVSAADLTIGAVDTTTYGQKKLEITYMGVTYKYDIEVVGIVSVAVNQGSYATSVRVFGTYNASSMTALAEYSDGTKKALTATDLAVGALDTATAGKKNLTVSYGGVDTTVEITVVGVASLEILGASDNPEILQGQTLNTSGVQAFVEYTDGTEGSLAASDLTFGSFDTSVAGDQKLTVTYLDKTVEYTIKVCSITALRVEGVNRVVPEGGALDLSNMKVYGVYNDTNETEVLIDAKDIVTNKDSLDFDVEGDKTLVVSYGKVSANVIISTTAPELVSIEIRGWQKYVKINDVFDKNSINVYAVYNNGAAEKVAGFTVTDVATDTAGAVKFTVTYTEDGVTKTAEQTVKVLGVSKIEVLKGTVPSEVYRGDALDVSGIELRVTYTDGEYVLFGYGIRAEDVTIPTIDTSVGGDHSFTVTYEGASATVPYKVIVEKSISILPGSVDSDLRAGYAVDYSGLKLNIVYENGDTKQVYASQLAGITYSGYEAGSESFSVTYRGMADSMALKLIKVVRISALNNTVPALVLQSAIIDYSTMRLSVYYDNGDMYLIPFTDPHLTVTPEVFDTSTPGWKAISFVYNDGISSFTYDVGLGPVTSFDFDTSVNVLVRGIKSVEIVTGSVFNKIYVGKKVDTSDISVKVTYDDGTYIYVNRNNPALMVGSVDTSKAGKVNLTVEFSGVTGSMEITVIDAPTLNGMIFGALLPDELVARESYKNNFKGSDSAYRVGDDNPYYFYLNVIQLDDNDNVIDVDGKSVPTVSTIYMDGSNQALSGVELDKYVAFNSYNNSYDFTDAAVGHTFRLVIRPADPTSYIDEASVTKEHTVTVVDGYNIYNAWELNVMTNVSRDITQACNGEANAIDQLTVVDKFLAKKGVTRPAKLNSIVLHCNLDIMPEDLPSEYFYIDEKGVNQGIYDQMGVFHRELSPDEKKFEIYGNYFSIYSYNIPCVTPKNVANNSDDYSASALIKVKISGAANEDIHTRGMAGDANAFDEYVVNIRDIATRDNDPNSNDQTASERHMRGLCCYKIGEMTANMENVNVDAYMTSLVLEHVGSTLNLNKVKFYNAWQGHLFLWNENNQQDQMGGASEETWSYIPDQVVNVTDSLLAKCGGPVILVQAPHYDEAYNLTNGVRVNVDEKSEVYTHVTGQEAWFVAVNQTQLAAQVKTMSQLISGPNGPHGYLSTDKIQGVETVNMIMVTMAGDGTALNGDFTNASYTQAGISSLLTHYSKNTKTYQYPTPVIDGILANKAPTFMSNYGGLGYYDGTQILVVANQNNVFYSGDKIALCYDGAGICLEYVHKPTT